MSLRRRPARPFDAISFDLFGTLLIADPARLPAMRVNGMVLRTPLAAALGRLAELRPAIDPAEALTAYAQAVAEIRCRIHDGGHRELPAWATFQACLDLLGVREGGPARALQQAFHQATLEALQPAPGAARLLQYAASRGYRLAIVSNLPDPTGRQKLLDLLAPARFAAALLSGDIGWRKPSPLIFAQVVAAFGVRPARILHVGDELDADVEGAAQMGMATAWISDAQAPARRSATFQPRDLTALRALL